MTRRGSMVMPAMRRGKTKYFKGLVDRVVSASICSVTRIVPISAAIARSNAARHHEARYRAQLASHG